ncbi:MAG TPA: GntR family transcriptional regulator [Candidatus Limiplasma sp.]|nr:GntR family transcriptional regulator [Candidatus Limiplasma sp.]
MTKSKYSIVADKLKSDIRGGAYPNGTRLPSDHELMRQTGYSRHTVRQAINLLEHEGLVYRVRGSGTYLRDAVRQQSTYNIAVVTTYIGEYIFPEILKGIDGVLSQNGYASMLYATYNRVENERKILGELLTKPIDGIIVEGTKTALPNPNIDRYQTLQKQGIPMVFINGYYPELHRIPHVVSDDRGGGKTACRYLLDKGCRRIAGIFKSDDIQGHRRYAGYAEAMLERELEIHDELVFWFTTENREDVLNTTLNRLNACDGVICYNDEIALLIAKAVHAGNLHPLAIASFDHSTYASLSPEPVFSLDSPKADIGSHAAEKLLDLLHSRHCTSAVLPWKDHEE